jgi:hypothetical protein
MTDRERRIGFELNLLRAILTASPTIRNNMITLELSQATAHVPFPRTHRLRNLPFWV